MSEKNLEEDKNGSNKKEERDDTIKKLTGNLITLQEIVSKQEGNSGMVNILTELISFNKAMLKMQITKSNSNITEFHPERKELWQMKKRTALLDEFSKAKFPFFKIPAEKIIVAHTNKLTVVDMTQDLANWMSKMPANLKKVAIFYLSIPGSHASTSYLINEDSDTSLDSSIFADVHAWYTDIVGGSWAVLSEVRRNWSITQNMDICTQLENGIRYIDLHVTASHWYAPGKKNIYTCNILYCGGVESVFTLINEFLDDHAEIIILDISGFYDFKIHHHQQLTNLIKNIFGSKLAPNMPEDATKITYNWLLKNHFQVIVIYRNKENTIFWESESWTNSAIFATDIESLIESNMNQVAERSPECGLVTQWYILPDETFIRKNWKSGLEAEFAKNRKDIIANIDQQSSGPNGYNVVVADFVASDNWEFVRTVVKLNEKLFYQLIKS